MANVEFSDAPDGGIWAKVTTPVLTWTGRKRLETPERPETLPKMVPIYEHECSEYPDALRVSFSDGSTAIYELRTEQPHPMVIKSIEIIRKWNTGTLPEEKKQRKWRKP